MKFYYNLYYCGRKSNLTPIVVEFASHLAFLKELNDWNKASLLAGKKFTYVAA
jgi:hypothetical protein